MSESARVSVVIPVWNGALTVQRSISSVIRQTLSDLELIVVDDGSTDETRSVVETIGDPRVTLISTPHSGVASARNTGIARSVGRLITFLDADDEAAPDWLASLAGPFNDPQVGLVCCGVTQRMASGERRALLPASGGELLGHRRVHFLAGSFMVRSDVLVQSGCYGPLTFGENYELGYRIVRVLDEEQLSVVALDQQLVSWFADARRSDGRDRGRLESAEYTLAHHKDTLTGRGAATVHRIAAVNARRIGRRSLALGHAIAALRADPVSWRNWKTLLGAGAPRSWLQAPSRRTPPVGPPSPVDNQASAGGPRVTVLIPAYNAASTVTAGVESIRNQTFEDYEILVVDDGSTDGTPETIAAIEDPRLRVIRLRNNSGIVTALNTGLSEARGSLIARLDADDVALPGRLAAQVRQFDELPDLALCCCAADRFLPNGALSGHSVPPRTHGEMAVALLIGNRIVHSSAMFRRDLAVSVGAYEPDAHPAEDYQLWLKLMKVGRIIGLPYVGVRFAISPDGISATSGRQQQLTAAKLSPMGGQVAAGYRRVRRLTSLVHRLREDLVRRDIPLAGTARQWRVSAFAEASGGRLRRWITVLAASPELLVRSVLESGGRP